MMRSLFAGVQGLRAHQVRMDVIGNNIANVNTTAFKGSRVHFDAMFSQTLTGPSRPTAAAGGTNPRQIGLGVEVSAIDVSQTQGALQLTGKATDMAISGNGFFVLRDGGRYVYTRAGNFDLDADGMLVNPSTGQPVQGWLPDSAGEFPARDASNMSDVRVPIADAQLARATTEVSFDQALNASAPVAGDPAVAPPAVPPAPSHTAAVTVIDSLGESHTITLEFFKRANNAWDIKALGPVGVQLVLDDPYAAAGNTILPAPGLDYGRLQFNTDGTLMDYDNDSATPFGTMTVGYAPANGASPLSVKLDFSKVIQPALPGDDAGSSLRAYDFDGYTTGSLSSIDVDSRGVVTGLYSNGNHREIAQIAMASFANPGGLGRETGNNWGESVNSGLALIGAAGEDGRGSIAPSNLEMSNVDISAEFTDMIVTQRGFQANSRIITATDELLQEVVNLKR